MPAQYVTSIVEGQDFYVADIDPTGVVSAPRGSVCLRVDAGNALVYYNATVANSPGTTWVPLLSTDLTDITQLILAANANPALQIGPAATLDLLKFVTTTGAAQVLVNTSQAAFTLTGGFGINLTGAAATFAATNKDALDIAKNATSQGVSSQGLGAIVTAEYAVPANAGPGAVDTNFVLTTTRAISVIDAYVVSSGTAAGSIQLRTTTGGITDAMVPSGTVSTLTRATVMAANTLAAGATLVVRAAAGVVAGNIVRVTFKVA
jgi:small neutral amino acid transporter SnatA (MarC family)